jgi:hypothetical protein
MSAYGPIARHLTAATLARGADAGAGVGLVLLAIAETGRPADGALLATGFTAPHLLGPWAARRLDMARDGRAVLAAAISGYAVLLAAAALALGRAPLAVAFAAVAAAGVCGPLLTGGLSSRLGGLAAGDDAAQGRAVGWDTVSYGVAGTAGPALVAVLAAAASPRAAVLALAACALAGGLLTVTLPAADADARPGAAIAVRQTLKLLLARGPLRRVGTVTLVTSASTAALGTVLAALLGAELSASGGAGAALAAAFGLGNLAGSLAVTAWPMTGDPERRTARWVAVVAATLAGAAVAPAYPLALAAFALAGAANAPFFAATLAARGAYAPPGARAQVFVSLAGAKVAAGSAGTALAGAASALGARPLLAGAAALTLAGGAVAELDRRLGAGRVSDRRQRVARSP